MEMSCVGKGASFNDGVSRVGVRSEKKENSIDGLEHSDLQRERTVKRRDEYTPPKGPLSFKHKLKLTLEEPLHSVWARRLSTFLFFVIIFSTVCFILESEVCKDRGCSSGFMPHEPYADIFYFAEWFSAVVFAVEYVSRLYACGDGWHARYVFVSDWGNLVDLVAFLVCAARLEPNECGRRSYAAHAPAPVAVLRQRLVGDAQVQATERRRQPGVRLHRLRACHPVAPRVPSPQGRPLLSWDQNLRGGH